MKSVVGISSREVLMITITYSVSQSIYLRRRLKKRSRKTSLGSTFFIGDNCIIDGSWNHHEIHNFTIDI